MEAKVIRRALSQGNGTAKRWLAGLLMLCGPLAGCNSIDTPRVFQVGRWFSNEDPLVVLRDSTDGNRRAEALGTLKEPLQNGGTPEQQELFLQILTTSATSDPEPFCRRRAITMLGKYKDPRAIQCLEQCCQQNHKFAPEMNSLMRQTALSALQETGDPASRRMLLVVARGVDSPVEASLTDRRQTLDERLAAVRGLGKFNQYDAIETLVHILETERDAGLRQCAHGSLMQATGKKYGADPAVWREVLRDPNSPSLPAEPSFIQRVTGIK